MIKRLLQAWMREAVRAEINQTLREMTAEYGRWAHVNRATEQKMGEIVWQQNDHNLAIAKVIAFLEKQGFSARDDNAPK